MKVDWSTLPPELLSEIAKHIEFRLDILRFNSVCKSWRSSLLFLTQNTKPKSNKIDPFIIPKPPILYPYCYSIDSDSKDDHYFLLTERTLCALRPNKSQINCVGGCGSLGLFGYGNWNTSKLAEFEQVSPSIFIPHRFSAKFTLRGFCKFRNMLDFNVSPISKFYGIVSVHNRKDGEDKDTFLGRFQFLRGSTSIVDKVVVFSNYNYVSIYYPINYSNDDCFLVVASLLRGGKVSLLRLLGPNFTPECVGWRVINNTDESFRVDDIVNLGGRLCVIDSEGRAFLVDLCSLELTQIASSPPPISNVEGLQLLARRKRLVEHSGDLYMLVPCRYKVNGELRPQIKVYKLREQTRDWVEIINLGDLSLFVGIDFSCGVYARTIFRTVECNRNCIFFVRLSFPLYNRSLSDDFEDLLFKELKSLDGVGVYDMPNGDNFELAPGGWYSEINYYLPCCLVDRSFWGFMLKK